jgi:phosphoribosylformimino-5-aminoimidazole carboxamide ribotide isomerase
MKDNSFTLYPAIDIKDGKCVRLLFGQMEKETVYNDNPLDQAMWFVDQGAEWLHIVDLDGAVAGENINKKVIEQILHKLQNKVKIQLGGGIRNINDIDFWIQNSVNRVILGTLALENPKFINQLEKKYAKKIVIGADVRSGKIAIHGWKKQSDVVAVDLIKELNPSIVSSVIYTDITKDGSLNGVSLEQTVNFAKSIPHSVIASGGVSSLNDISSLAKELSNGVKGVIVGRALYDQKFTFSDALQKIKEAKSYAVD